MKKPPITCPKCGSSDVVVSSGPSDNILTKLKDMLVPDNYKGQKVITCKKCKQKSVIFIM